MNNIMFLGNVITHLINLFLVFNIAGVNLRPGQKLGDTLATMWIAHDINHMRAAVV